MNILVISNSNWNILNFRKSFINDLEKKNQVYVLNFINDSVQIEKEFKNKINVTGITRNKINALEIFNFVRTVKKIIRENDINVLYSFTFNISVILSFLNFGNLKTISIITGFGKLYTDNNFFYHIIFKTGLMFINKFDKIFVQNRFDYKILNKKISNSKLNIIPGSGVDTSFFDIKKTKKENLIKFIYVGRFLSSKGLDIIINVFSLPEILKLSCRLTIIGDYDSNDKKFKLQKTPPNVVIKPWSLNVKEQYNDSHCSILMSNREGLSKSLLESLSCRTPIIAYGAPGVIDIFEKSDYEIGILIKNRKQYDLKNAILKFVNINQKIYNKMCENSRRLIIENFSEEIVNKRLKL